MAKYNCNPGVLDRDIYVYVDHPNGGSRLTCVRKAQHYLWDSTLRWSWVDPKEGIIEIPEEITKTGDAQTLPLSGELINVLKKQFRQDDAPVFDTTNFRKEFQQACVAVGLGEISKMVSARSYKWEKYEGVTPHDFRRSGIRNMVRPCVPGKSP